MKTQTNKTALRNLHRRYYLLGKRLERAVDIDDRDERRLVTRLIEETLASIRQMHRR